MADEAERRIAEVYRTGGSYLDLANLELAAVPESVARLTHLTELDLDHNRLTSVPDWIDRLTNLRTLNLSDNQLTSLPESFSRLSNLDELELSDNPLRTLPEPLKHLSSLTGLVLCSTNLTALPDWIGLLTNMVELDLSGNRLTTLPGSIGRLGKLGTLGLDDNPLTVVPEPIRQLSQLSGLSMDATQLTVLPNWLGGLTDLHRSLTFGVDDNPLIYPPPAVMSQGTAAVLAFLRAAHLAGARQPWRAKLVLVGEGRAGKTTLVKAMSNAGVDPAEPTTHGLTITDLPLPHPTEPDAVLRFSGWDFGGQPLYHATHQFFLTGQSLFLLVWDAERGIEQGRVRYWLDIVAARTGGGSADPDLRPAPVILVATHAAGRAPDLPLAQLRAEHPNIIAAVDVDSLDGLGIQELRASIAETAVAELPHLAQSWPATWAAAREKVRTAEATHLDAGRFDDLLAAAGVLEPDGRRALTGLLHRIGEILHYEADPELSGTVVLKPAWLSERIAALLDSKPVTERGGLVLEQDITAQWADLSKELRRQLLTLMELYDVCYRVRDSPGRADDARAVVVDRLPTHAPEDLRTWDTLAPPRSLRLRLNYRFDTTVPPGIPGWFIARTHRFATTGHRPWRTGVLLAHPDGLHLGMLNLAQRTAPTVELEVRGPRPAGFLAILDEIFTATLDRYPGAEISRMIPCPCRPDCPTSWRFDTLTAHRGQGLSQVQCGESLGMVDIALLVDGVHPALPAATWATGDTIGTELAELRLLAQTLLAESRDGFRQLRHDNERIHRTVLRHFSWAQATTPTLFTLTGKSRRLRGAQRYTLRLYCAAPNAIHQLPDNRGCYEVTVLDEWAGALARRLNLVATLLSTVTGMVMPILGIAVPDLVARNKDDLEKAKTALEGLKRTAETVEGHIFNADLPTGRTVTEADARVIADLLTPLRGKDNWGGLAKTTTETGETLYLCEDHARAYTQPATRPLDL